MPYKKNIFVTRSLVPARASFAARMRESFASRSLTNNGPHVIRLEETLKNFLGVPWLLACVNGTMALELALHAANAAGKRVITSPFTYVATASAPLWIGCDVIFADIDEETLCINPEKIAEKLTPDTAAILPVDVYGHACEFEKIGKTAGGIPVIYDAAQAFGAALNGVSLFSFGDYATCSLHATKVFHTFEGGFIVCRTREAYERLLLSRAFGHCGDTHVLPGTNAKMSEAHAAMGLALFGEFESHLLEREKLSRLYDSLLDWKNLRKPAVLKGFKSNYAYYPVIFASENMLLRARERLEENGIHPRRYFYPALTMLPYIKGQSCPVAEDIAPRVLCLPLYSGLETEYVEKTARIVNFTTAG